MAGGVCGPRSESGNSRQTDITETEGGGERGWSQVLALQALDRQQSFTASRASLVAQLVKNLPAMQETWVLSLGWEDPLEKGKATLSSMLA